MNCHSKAGTRVRQAGTLGHKIEGGIDFESCASIGLAPGGVCLLKSGALNLSPLTPVSALLHKVGERINDSVAQTGFFCPYF